MRRMFLGLTVVAGVAWRPTQALAAARPRSEVARRGSGLNYSTVASGLGVQFLMIRMRQERARGLAQAMSRGATDVSIHATRRGVVDLDTGEISASHQRFDTRPFCQQRPVAANANK